MPGAMRNAIDSLMYSVGYTLGIVKEYLEIILSITGRRKPVAR